MLMPGLHCAAGCGPLIDSITRDLMVTSRKEVEHERRDGRQLFVPFFASNRCFGDQRLDQTRKGEPGAGRSLALIFDP